VSKQLNQPLGSLRKGAKTRTNPDKQDKKRNQLFFSPPGSCKRDRQDALWRRITIAGKSNSQGRARRNFFEPGRGLERPRGEDMNTGGKKGPGKREFHLRAGKPQNKTIIELDRWN